MPWIPVATMIASAALSAHQANKQRQAQADANQQSANISAGQAEFSPWTGANPQAVQTSPLGTDALGGAVQGGLAGAMFANGMKKSDAEVAKLAAETAAIKGGSMAPTASPGISPFDYNKYGSSLRPVT